MVKEKIIDFLKKNGPSLPVEINKAIGYDTFFTQALMSELISDGLVKKSKRPIGNSLIYYLQEHAERMREKIYNDLSITEKKVLQRIREVGRITSQDLNPHERAFIEQLQDFVRLERIPNGYIVNYYSYYPSENEIKPIIIPKTEQLNVNAPLNTVKTQETLIRTPEAPKTIETPTEIKNQTETVTTEQKKQNESNAFEKKARKYLEEIGEITNTVKIKANTEYNYDLRIKKPFTQELLVKAKNKKSINETDLSMIYAEALQTKKPAVLLTNGKLTSKAKQWKDTNAGELIRIIEF